jgi:glycosyltransferase involved in cell wall biosynthesis
MILLDALHVNNSGGKVLLDYLIAELHASGREVFYLLDERVAGSYPFLPAGQALYLPAGLLARYRFYRQQRGRFRAVLCFGNLPPPLRQSCPVYTYFHNVLYLDFPAGGMGLKRAVFYLKTAYLKALLGHTTEWWVQTEEVKALLCRRLGVAEERVQVYPFYPGFSAPAVAVAREPQSFLYVSDANPHKNHARLLEAFALVQREYPTARLYLTVGPAYPAILRQLESLAQQGLPVVNLGLIGREALQAEYARRACLVYPSLRESFGLGLLEAAAMGMPILGADLPYTHAVIEPTAVFDPLDVVSMAGAMAGFLQQGGAPAGLKAKNSMAEILKHVWEH